MPLTVDMRLSRRRCNDNDDSSSSEEEEEPVLPVRLRKKRPRYNVLDESEEESEEEEDESVGIRNEQDDKPQYEFELPPCNDSSSSSDEESVSNAALLPPQQQPQEDSLLDEGFFTAPAWYHDSTNKENMHVSYLNETKPRHLTRRQEDEERPPPIEVVDLCCDEGDEERSYDAPLSSQEADPDEPWQPTPNPENPRPLQTRYGLRTPSKSPCFNLRSRAACLPSQPPFQEPWHPHQHLPLHSAAAAMPSSPTVAAPAYSAQPYASYPPPEEEYHQDDDIVDCWSDEERPSSAMGRPRRVTDYPMDHHPHPDHHRHPPTRTATTATTRDNAPFVAAPHRRATQAQHQQSFLQHSFHERRRVRDATASNPSLAKSVVSRKKGQTQATTQKPPPVSLFASYREGQPVVAAAATATASFASTRNDLAGGSGVGAGNYVFWNNNKDDDEEDNPKATTQTTSRRTAAPKKRKAAAKRKTAKKSWGGRGRGRGRRNYGGRKRGGGGGNAKGRGRRGRGGGSSSNAPDYSRADPDLAHVGGANISF